MKKLCFLMIVLFLAIPLAANAGIIGDVTLSVSATDPIGYVASPFASGNYYLDYDVSLNGGPLLEAFCVENSPAPAANVSADYTLLSIDGGLSAFSLDPNRYLTAAWIAEYYWNTYEGTTNEETWKAAAQIAVWEIIFDYGNYNLAGDIFKSNAYSTEADTLLALIPGATIPTSSASWVLAVSPQVDSGQNVTVENYQNYIVRVPEPANMLLLGTGLIGLAAIGRKKFFKK